jgi:hypothetical protein
MARSPQLRRTRSEYSTGTHIFGAPLNDADNLVCEGCDPGATGRQVCLPHVHLHPLIALHIVTKFLA